MSKIGDYKDWKQDHTTEYEQETFIESGKIPVSGKYDAQGQSETRNISLGELYGANVVPDPGTDEHRGEVLTVSDSDEIVWAAPQGGGSDIPDYRNLPYDSTQDSGQGVPYKLICTVASDPDTGVISRTIKWTL